MKIDAPITMNGWACITEDGDVCFGEAESSCDECPDRETNECVPVVVEIIPTNEYADRQLRIDTMNDTHNSYKEALERIKLDVQDLKKSLNNIPKGLKDDRR